MSNVLTFSVSAAGWGGRRAAARHWFWRAADAIGALHSWRTIEWHRVRRVVMVCKGNICRSPYAEARARHHGLIAVSCGLECGPYAPANDTAIRNAAARRLDLRRHRTMPLDALALGPGDLLLAMEPAQAQSLAPAALASGAQVTLLGLWAQPRRPYLHDPYGLDDEAFQRCYAAIDSALASIRRRIG